VKFIVASELCKATCLAGSDFIVARSIAKYKIKSQSALFAARHDAENSDRPRSFCTIIHSTRTAWRDVPNGILWILRTGAPWKDLPARELHARGGLDLSEAIIDGSFASAKKGRLAAPLVSVSSGTGH
jgi:hypothetical protein